MTVKMQTESGAVYTLDTEAMTWRRVGTVSVPGMTASEGKMYDYPYIEIGQRGTIFAEEYGTIHTTRIVRLEVVS